MKVSLCKCILSGLYLILLLSANMCLCVCVCVVGGMFMGFIGNKLYKDMGMT